ncbi:MAG: NTP transferase domain-containing protein [Candidatus Korarchaeota archaeon]|nr:NTP transferase domain-containing protein [Candidatus Korarchaeota archaeon]
MRRPPAIILAAGKATRMRPYSLEVPKALFELAPNLTVLDLTIRWLREEGIRDIIIVTRPSLARFFVERYGDSVKVVTTDREEGFGNLYSFLTGVKAADSSEYLVLMSDHIFEPEILRRMLRKGGSRAFTLSLDRNPPWDKLEEGLKVVLEDGEVKEVGKDAVPHYGIDTGIFYCTEKAEVIARETIEEKGEKATIADALRKALAYGEVSYVDVTGLIWMDVDTPEELEEARKILPLLLRRSLIKPGDGPVSRYINRQISTRLSVALFLRGIYVSPNLISLLAFSLMGLAAVLIYRGFLVPAALIIQLSSIIDGMDGEIARLFGTASEFGGLLDAFLDRYSDLLIVAAIGTGVTFLEPWQIFLLGLAAGNVFVTSYVSHLAGWSTERVVRLRAWSPASRDVRLLVAAVTTALGMFLPFLWYMALVPLAFSAYMVIASRIPEKPIKLERRTPKPEVKVKRVKKKVTPLEANLRVLLASSIKLTLWVIVIRLFYGLVTDLGPLMILDLKISPVTVLNIAEFIVVVYFGYRILLSIKSLLDLLSKWLVREMGLVTEAAVKRALADIFYLAIISLLIIFVPNYLEGVPLGGIVSKVALLVLLFLFLLFFYDLAKLFYRSFKGFFDRQISKIAERLSVAVEGEK